MNKKKLTYIDECGLMFEQFGMARMVGRVFGYLLICDEDAVSFDQIREVLNASKGSISGTTKQLIQIGFIETVSLPGDRKTYFKVTDIELGKMLSQRMKLFEKFSEVLDKGRELKEREDDVSVWLRDASFFYSWVGDEIGKTIQKWHREKENLIKEKE